MLFSGCVARGGGKVHDRVARRQLIAIGGGIEQVSLHDHTTLRRAGSEFSGSIERDDAITAVRERLQQASADESRATGYENGSSHHHQEGSAVKPPSIMATEGIPGRWVSVCSKP